MGNPRASASCFIRRIVPRIIAWQYSGLSNKLTRHFSIFRKEDMPRQIRLIVLLPPTSHKIFEFSFLRINAWNSYSFLKKSRHVVDKIRISPTKSSQHRKHPPFWRFAFFVEATMKTLGSRRSAYGTFLLPIRVAIVHNSNVLSHIKTCRNTMTLPFQKCLCVSKSSCCFEGSLIIFAYYGVSVWEFPFEFVCNSRLS